MVRIDDDYGYEYTQPKIIEQTECYYYPKRTYLHKSGTYRIYLRLKDNKRGFKSFASYCDECGIFETDEQRVRYLIMWMKDRANRSRLRLEQSFEKG
jgi:hypothetical protein